MLVTHPTAAVEWKLACDRAWSHFAPPPNISVSEWARRYRIIPEGTSPRPGRFRPEKFQIEIMDAFRDPAIHEIVVKKSTQLGITDAVLFNVIGYFIHLDPKPIIYVQPTKENARDKGKKVITPMINASPVLAERVRRSTARRAGNTLTLKEFPGGFLKLAGANAAPDLRSDGVPIVLFDEIDGYPKDVDGEGNPLDIAIRRTDTYPDFKIAKISTPGQPEGFSSIESAYEATDQRTWQMPCPFCAQRQPFIWREETGAHRFVYQVDADRQVIRDSVGFKCARCASVIPERHKWQMLEAGEWVAKYPGRAKRGYFIWAAYSPWRENWADLCQEWVDAQRESEKLKAFINLRLGETWKEEGLSLKSHQLRKRCEKYCPAGDDKQWEVPKGVGLLTAAVDVQDDRLVVVVKGWGALEESWLIAWQEFFGDPGREAVWNEVDEFLKTEFRHQSGRTLGIHAAFVDSGGHHTDSVYKFAKGRNSRRIFACKGSSEAAKEIVGKFSQNNTYRVRLYLVGTDTAKDRIFSRLQIPSPGASYMHLPDWIDDEYLAQLTSEKRVTRYKKGKGMSREYIKTRERNEALDLEVYNLAALYSLGNMKVRSLAELAEQANEPPEAGEAEAKARVAAAAAGQQAGSTGASQGRPGGSNWVNSWRD